MKYLVGIDEAGRGPVAGPVIVAALSICGKSKAELIKNAKALVNYFPQKKIKDSKKLSRKNREKIFSLLKNDKKIGKIDYAFHFSSNKVIDSKGISYAINFALKKSLEKIGVNDKSSTIMLDGSLKAPPKFIDQHTIIKGDEKEVIIALASVVAKVNRDMEMVKISKRFPQYDFDIHKGYGTRFHYEKIKKFGISAVHRNSFL